MKLIQTLFVTASISTRFAHAQSAAAGVNVANVPDCAVSLMDAPR